MIKILLTAILICTSMSGITAATEEGRAAFAAGQAAMRAQDFAASQAQFETAVASDPSNTEYLSLLGLVYLRTGQAEAAARTYAQMCGIIEAKYGILSTRIYGCHTLWANALLMSRDAPRAVEKFRSAYAAAIAQKPPSIGDCLMALSSLSHTLNTPGQIAEVIPLYEALLAQVPADSRYRSQVEAALRAVQDGKMPPPL